ncbi:pyridoxamine 5'-phosphate oxidase family protein [Oceanobacillus senegalensis]|uniref:pyridoxamine 5'-phosphate oxidase family protein n=1 Tax=Oceanobacillus senegalensis TaxID=1936063 RepID=UPI000A30F711|nr:pyridoxamine 5'-phosphate oxidase family protein [Oceanobacillus senegalensis]
MSQTEIRDSIGKILNESHTGTMATVKNNKPHSRYMTFFHRDLTLYTPTDRNTDKTEEINANPYTHIIIGYDGDGFGDAYVEYQGKVTFNESEELKKEFWHDDMKLYFDGPEDSNYILLEVHPISIRLMNKKGKPPMELDMKG